MLTNFMYLDNIYKGSQFSNVSYWSLRPPFRRPLPPARLSQLNILFILRIFEYHVLNVC